MKKINQTEKLSDKVLDAIGIALFYEMLVIPFLIIRLVYKVSPEKIYKVVIGPSLILVLV